MKEPDILSELRAWRDEFARSHGYDLRAMAAALSELDATAGREVVRGEPRHPEVTQPPRISVPSNSLPQTDHANKG